MSLDYSAHIGYGFFVYRIPELDRVKEIGLVEAIVEMFDDSMSNGSELLSVHYAEGMSSTQSKAFITIASSSMSTDCRSSSYDENDPFLINSYPESATEQELFALQEAAQLCGIGAEDHEPASYFYIVVS